MPRYHEDEIATMRKQWDELIAERDAAERDMRTADEAGNLTAYDAAAARFDKADDGIAFVAHELYELEALDYETQQREDRSSYWAGAL